MAKDYLEASRARQKRYTEQKKEDGYKKIQVFISEYDYSRLVEMGKNRNKTFAEVISASISCKYRTWGNYRVYKD